MNVPMKLDLVTPYDPKALNSWGGGVSYFMANAFKEQSVLVDCIGPVKEKKNKFISLKWHFYKYILREIYHTNRAPSIAKGFARQVEEQLAIRDTDVVLSLLTPPMAYLDCNQSLVLWADATFADLIDFYPEFTNLCQETIRDGHFIDQEAFNKAKLAIFTSDWAAKTAINFYKIEPSKVRVVSYGANLVSQNITIDDVKILVKSRPSNQCNLLFLGTNWLRKGGPLTLEVTRMLNEAGLPTKLTVVGCEPLASELPSFVEPLGFVDKSSAAGAQKLYQLLRESHFLVLPSIADCTPNVFCEANSFALPCISTKVGGIETTIKDGVNGKTFSLNANSSDYCTYILGLFSNYANYKELAISSFNEYESRLNWVTSTGIVKNLIKEIL
jgi:glycosyltransferase involved in cell wall biosynthesis